MVPSSYFPLILLMMFRPNLASKRPIALSRRRLERPADRSSPAVDRGRRSIPRGCRALPCPWKLTSRMELTYRRDRQAD